MSDLNRRYEEAEDVRRLRAARNVLYLEGCFTEVFSPSIELVGISIRPPNREKTDFLIVLRGVDHDGSPVVAFHGATGLLDALAGAGERLRNGTLSWRPDAYAK